MVFSVLSVVMRTAHVLAGGVWIGGGIMYLLVLTPAFQVAKASAEVRAAVGRYFRRLVNICISVLILSGVYLIFDRLTAVSVGPSYIVTLVIKVLLALAMFGLALFQAQEARRPLRKRGRLWRLAPLLILYLGIVVFILGAALTYIFESGLATLR